MKEQCKLKKAVKIPKNKSRELLEGTEKSNIILTRGPYLSWQINDDLQKQTKNKLVARPAGH